MVQISGDFWIEGLVDSHGKPSGHVIHDKEDPYYKEGVFMPVKIVREGQLKSALKWATQQAALRRAKQADKEGA